LLAQPQRHCVSPKAQGADRYVNPHQRLTGFDLLTDVHQPFDDLAGNPKAEIALHPRPDDAGEAAF
jgi:hypothetical protein